MTYMYFDLEYNIFGYAMQIFFLQAFGEKNCLKLSRQTRWSYEACGTHVTTGTCICTSIETEGFLQKQRPLLLEGHLFFATTQEDNQIVAYVQK